MKETVKDIGEEFLAESEAVGSVVGGGDGGADDNFSMGKSENIGRGRVAKVDLVETTTLAGGDEDDSDFGRETRSPRLGEAHEGTFNLATEERQCQRVSPLAIGPVDGDGFFEHGGLEGSGCVGEGYSRGRKRGRGGRYAIGYR
jgi:hypothetical protein